MSTFTRYKSPSCLKTSQNISASFLTFDAHDHPLWKLGFLILQMRKLRTKVLNDLYGGMTDYLFEFWSDNFLARLKVFI
jgi:hypothetical protein